MRVAVLGAGAMGMLFGGYLSQKNDVWLVDVDPLRVEKINMDGVRIREKNGEATFHPTAVMDTQAIGTMDLVLVFVKAMYTESALSANRSLIGQDTYIMSLQNGAGHEAELLRFADRKHVVIGSTQHNSSLISNGFIQHGGAGKTSIGLVDGGSEVLVPIAEMFTACRLDCVTSNEIKRQIWTKLFTNTAASALTAVLQAPLGYLVENEYAHELMRLLCHEAVAVANAEGFARFDEAEAIADVESVCRNAKNGYTSIYADVKEGRRTEVDTISGSIVATAGKLNIPVPYHEMIVRLIHALEQKPKE